MVYNNGIQLVWHEIYSYGILSTQGHRNAVGSSAMVARQRDLSAMNHKSPQLRGRVYEWTLELCAIQIGIEADSTADKQICNANPPSLQMAAPEACTVSG